MFGAIHAHARTPMREAAEWVACGVKRCSKCKQEWPFEAFNAEPRARDRHRPECRDCQQEAAREGYRRKVASEGVAADLRPASQHRLPS